MALTLECNCSGDTSVCNLTKLTWLIIVSEKLVGGGAVGAEIHTFTLFRDPSDPSSPFEQVSSPGSYAIDLPISTWAPYWATITQRVNVDASTFQVPSPLYSAYDAWGGSAVIQQDYGCINPQTGEVTTWTVYSTPQIGVGGECVTGPGDLRSICADGTSGVMLKSTPLGTCNGCTGDSSLWIPTVNDNIKIDNSASGQICLCATGGSGEYEYSILSGNLPCGQTLNKATGCIEGVPDGTCGGSASITFQVLDLGGAGGGGGGGVTIGGTCRTFGFGVTRESGGAWDSSMNGQPIIIGGVTYTVDTVSGPDNLSLTTTAGIVDPTTWSYTSPVVPPPPPSQPATATVTCGFLSSGCTGGVGAGNSAY